MPELRVTHPHDLGKLLGEITAAVPALAPVPGAAGRLVAVLSLSGDGTTVDAVWPAGVVVDPAAVQAVIAAHDPTPLPVPPAPLATLGAAFAAVDPTAAADLATLKADVQAMKAAVLKFVAASG